MVRDYNIYENEVREKIAKVDAWCEHCGRHQIASAFVYENEPSEITKGQSCKKCGGPLTTDTSFEGAEL